MVDVQVAEAGVQNLSQSALDVLTVALLIVRAADVVMPAVLFELRMSLLAVAGIQLTRGHWRGLTSPSAFPKRESLNKQAYAAG